MNLSVFKGTDNSRHFLAINKGVILDHKENLFASLVKGGILILSGLLTSDLDDIVTSFEPLFDKPFLSTEKNNWISLAFNRLQ